MSDEQARSIVYRQGPTNPEEEHLCYRATVPGHEHELAEGKYPGLELYDRIQVNGVQPRAIAKFW
jgi:hypothetical protein